METAYSPHSRVRNSMLFEDLSDGEYAALCEHSRNLQLNDGDLLFEHGQPVREFFYLSAGQLKLTRLSAEGNEKVIDIIRAGETFAEAAMFLGSTGYPVNAQAVGACELLTFSTERYLECLRKSQQACFSLLGRMSQRLHFQLNEIDRMTLHSATYRLVAYLLDQAPANGQRTELHLGIPKHVIASRLSIKPETLSRILGRLSKSGMIEVHDNQIVLVDAQALRRHLQQGVL
jgi:CRP-like cAMP-binding protein